MDDSEGPNFDEAQENMKLSPDSIRTQTGLDDRPTNLNALETRSGEFHANLLVECTACGNLGPKDNAMTAPCGHHYCSICINEHFKLVTRDESL